MKIKNKKQCNFIIKFYSLNHNKMKNLKILTLSGIILLAGFLSGCWNNSKVNGVNNTENTNSENDKVIDYNDSIVKIASKCHESAMSTRDSYNNKDEITQTETSAKNTISECEDSINQINILWDREWDSSLKDWMVSLLNLYVTYFTKFNEMLTYLENENHPKEDIESYEIIVKEIKDMDSEIESENNSFINTQKLFANNHWFELEENNK